MSPHVQNVTVAFRHSTVVRDGSTSTVDRPSWTGRRHTSLETLVEHVHVQEDVDSYWLWSIAGVSSYLREDLKARLGTDDTP